MILVVVGILLWMTFAALAAALCVMAARGDRALEPAPRRFRQTRRRSRDHAPARTTAVTSRLL